MFRRDLSRQGRSRGVRCIGFDIFFKREEEGDEHISSFDDDDAKNTYLF